MAACSCAVAGEAQIPVRSELDPRGEIHVPIGIANTVDTLKTFVEAEGCFSPGFGSYGIYFWLYDRDAKKLFAPTMRDVRCEHGLSPEGYLIPWSEWDAGGVRVRSEVCQVLRASPGGNVHVVGARVRLTNTNKTERRVTLYTALRPLGPAGWAVKQMSLSEDGAVLLVDGHAALVSTQDASAAGVSDADDIGTRALAGELPSEKTARSAEGNCSGAVCFEVTFPPDGTREFGFIGPVLPGRRAVGHSWDPGGQNNYKEVARLNPEEADALAPTRERADVSEANARRGGMDEQDSGPSPRTRFGSSRPSPTLGGGQTVELQPDPGLAYYRGLRVETLFDEARRYWKDLSGRVALNLPDGRWNQAFAAITGHVALCLNDGAPDVSVINYTTFNRDGVYNVNILQKAGVNELAGEAVGLFIKHPFNGRPYPEADNPGQDLWILGQHWFFTKDRAWLERVYPAAQKLAALIRYYRTTPEPHWVELDGLRFGDEVPADRRHRLEPGSCDGKHPEYTEAFDIAGLRAASELAAAMGRDEDAVAHRKLADELFARYDQRFSGQLPKGYGNYSVLWPCRLYPLESGKAFEQFRNVGKQKAVSWRYFPLATAHQGLLAGNREAAHATLSEHLDHPQMRGWYVFDEGGDSGVGGWGLVRTTWNGKVAMPHGWAIAELFLLIRDSLAFEDDGYLVLLAGVPETWFRPEQGWSFSGLPTHFGACGVTVKADGNDWIVSITGKITAPKGVVLRLPPGLKVSARDDGARERLPNGAVLLTEGVREVAIRH